MVTFPMTLTDPSPVFKVTVFLKSNISNASYGQSYYSTLMGNLPNIWNDTMFGDLD